jgi:hypothetical protein
LRLKSSPTIEIAGVTAANDRLLVTELRACRARSSRNLNMNTAPDLSMSTTIAATDLTKAAAPPRINLLSHGFSIDHPDQELGEQLMANALGVTDREAMHGIIRQLVKASVSGESPDEVNLSFMISMVKSIKPRGSIEAMLVAITSRMPTTWPSTTAPRAHWADSPVRSRPDRGAEPPPEPWRALRHRAERVGRRRRQGHYRQRHAACARDRVGQEPGIRGAEGAEGRGLQAKARFR